MSVRPAEASGAVRAGATRPLSYLLAALFLGLLTWVAPAPVAHAAAMVGELELTAVTVTPDGIELDLTVTNTGSTPMYGGQVMLWRDRTSRTTPAELAAALAAEPDTGLRLGEPVRSAYHVLGDQRTAFEPGAEASFTLTATWDQLDLTAEGVYRVGADLWASPDSRSGGEVVARARTLVVRRGGVTAERATFVRLTSQPAQLTGDRFIDDHLADEFAGRLADLARAAARPGVGWLLDPALYAAAQAMAAGYQVVGPDGDTPGRGTAAAADWLALVDALPRATGYRTPWGDPDLALGAATQDNSLIDRAVTTLAAVAAENTTPGFAAVAALPLALRPTAGLADASYLAYTATLKPALILAQTAVEGPPTSLVPTALTPYPGGPTPDPETPLQLEQRAQADDYLAALLGQVNVRVLTSQADLAADRAAVPDWISLLPASDVKASDSIRPTETAGPSVPHLSEAERDACADVASRFATYAELVDDEAVAAELGQLGLSLALSQNWSDRPAAHRYIDALRAEVDGRLDQVQVLLSDRLILTSHDAAVPVTVSNTLPQAVQVRLEFTSSSPLRLTATYDQVIDVRPGDQLGITLKPRVSANGTIQLSARLTTASGRPLGDPVVTEVAISESGRLAWSIVAVSGAILAVGTVLRVKTVQKSRRAAAGAANRGDSSDV